MASLLSLMHHQHNSRPTQRPCHILLHVSFVARVKPGPSAAAWHVSALTSRAVRMLCTEALTAATHRIRSGGFNGCRLQS